MLRNILAIFCGGGIGASLRYLVGYYSVNLDKTNIHWITLSINTISCLLIGLLFSLFIDKPQVSSTVKLGLMVGFCGGFSTYAAFSVDVLGLIRSEQIIQAIMYITLTLILGLLAVWMGAKIGKIL